MTPNVESTSEHLVNVAYNRGWALGRLALILEISEFLKVNALPVNPQLTDAPQIIQGLMATLSDITTVLKKETSVSVESLKEIHEHDTPTL